MLRLRSAQLLRVNKPNLFNDLKKGVFFPEQSKHISHNEKTVKLHFSLGVEMGVATGGALKCIVELTIILL